jgi:REP element-mobilizing transposase RayT
VNTANEKSAVGTPPLQKMRKPRLKRLDRVFADRPLYFVTAGTEGRRRFLANYGVYDAFREFCEVGLKRGFYVGRFVLMPDHLHLFIVVPRDVDQALSGWVKALKRSLARKLGDQEVAPPHWQKGFFDHVMRSRESYSEKWDYVRNNPVRAGLVAEADAWPFQGEIAELRFD